MHTANAGTLLVIGGVFWGHVFIGGTLSFLHGSCGSKVLLGVIINNWRHIITFWGQGFIGGRLSLFGGTIISNMINSVSIVSSAVFPPSLMVFFQCEFGTFSPFSIMNL